MIQMENMINNMKCHRSLECLEFSWHTNHTYIILLANNFLEKEKRKKNIDNIEQILANISDQYDFLTLKYTDK